MKKLIIVISLALAFVGCGSAPSGMVDMQAILDLVLPPGFVGNAKFKHKNPYITIDVTATGLKKDPATGEWTWKSLVYDRDGRVSFGNIILVPEGVDVNGVADPTD